MTDTFPQPTPKRITVNNDYSPPSPQSTYRQDPDSFKDIISNTFTLTQGNQIEAVIYLLGTILLAGLFITLVKKIILKHKTEFTVVETISTAYILAILVFVICIPFIMSDWWNNEIFRGTSMYALLMWFAYDVTKIKFPKFVSKNSYKRFALFVAVVVPVHFLLQFVLFFYVLLFVPKGQQKCYK